MDKRYQEWIQANVEGDGFGDCREVTERMAAQFPELRRVRGFYEDWLWGDREHWWLVAPDGSIVDPTAEQFPTKGRASYREWKEGAKEPVGMCPNCGGYIFEDHGGVCSDLCGKQYAAYIMGSLR
jgi:hypothetical protein